MFLLKVIAASFKLSTQLPSPLMNIGLSIMWNNVLLNLSVNTAFKSLYVEYISVSYSLSKDLIVVLYNSLPLSTHKFFSFSMFA